MQYETKINPLTGEKCSLPVGSTDEQWRLQFEAQKVMLEQLALLDDDEEE